MTIPFFPPDPSCRDLLPEVVREVGLPPDRRFVPGGRTARWKAVPRDSLGVSDAVAYDGGTPAPAPHAPGVGPGDEVVVPAHGFSVMADMPAPRRIARDVGRSDELVAALRLRRFALKPSAGGPPLKVCTEKEAPMTTVIASGSAVAPTTPVARKAVVR